MELEDLIKWAREEADRLSAHSGRSGVAAADFLRRHGGDTFGSQADQLVTNEVAMRSVARDMGRPQKAMAQLLRAWADYAEAGLADQVPLEAIIRIEAATDLLEQVQRLLDDPSVHVAAPVVLAGAALEEFLRSMMVGSSEGIAGAPSLSKYAAALRKSGKLTAQDEKDITSWAGQRNSAAHGKFQELDTARARLMVDAINLFIRQKS